MMLQAVSDNDDGTGAAAFDYPELDKILEGECAAVFPYLGSIQ